MPDRTIISSPVIPALAEAPRPAPATGTAAADWLSQRQAARQAGNGPVGGPASPLEAVVQANFELIREDVLGIVGQYANTLKTGGGHADVEPML